MTKANDLWLEADDIIEVAMNNSSITDAEWYIAMELCASVQEEAQNLDDILDGKVKYAVRTVQEAR